MSPERRRQIDELYHAALERDPDRREGFLAEACRGDPELRREVALKILIGIRQFDTVRDTDCDARREQGIILRLNVGGVGIGTKTVA